MPKAAASQTDDRAVVDKAFRLLFGLQINGDAGTGVSALARQTELSKTTAHRLLGMLERNGAVDRVGTAYRVGLALKRLARPAEDVRIEQMRDAIIPFMTDLHVATGAAVHLAVVENDRTLFLNRIYGHNSARSRVRIGHVAPAHANAVGKALLAHTPDTVERIINQGLPRLTELTITDPEDFRRELGRIRVEGLSTDREEAIPGFYCLAVTVGGHGGLPRLGLSLAGLTSQEVATHGALLRRVRVEIDRRLLALAS